MLFIWNNHQILQLVSSAEQVYTDRRSNLKGENAEKLLFLVYNIHLFDFHYWLENRKYFL